MSAKYLVTRNDGGPPIPDDEPCFIIRAQDVFAPAAVSFYYSLVQGLPPEFLNEVMNHYHRIIEWQRLHSRKIPD